LFLSSIYNTLEPQNSISIDCKEFSLSWLCPLKAFLARCSEWRKRRVFE
jgi:hypothetical protein